ncbi:hypothetical protein FBY51_1101 [Zymomonas mobilis]|uniref:glucosamine inositolphosphorylceramide transferase family protein n=1 Tax=Zymomonas mobilis TaxID=542 RepID=UPI00026D804F|nr:hypothetical protein [Zymomonas mobilis]AFN57498.1 hypothetical protein ZZ6_1640 [Zymomonas mobilis subsp. mobilis ATCC 29191]TQK78735.1 hypothetical protein FBY53_1426 [Zymomonas mobilis]TQL16060.1 hypothetical protein FBY51_1101 [Zymomonas mobilis]GEB86870.1 hypothetical protein ZMO01_02100 [Zymomonas mobilis subsp. mobilis]
MGIRKDLWRIFLVKQPITDILQSSKICGEILDITRDLDFYCFSADPFGFEKDNTLYVFSEYYDYMSRKGVIECQSFNKELQIISQKTVLSEDWHLSYPYVFEADNQIYMLPEASRNHKLTLYHAISFPNHWERLCDIDLGGDIAIDATPVFHDGMWWLFYMSGYAKARKKQELHAAYARELTGKWTVYKNNPVIEGFAYSRPGGSAVINKEGKLVLPVQDCVTTYGRAVRSLLFNHLSPDLIQCSVGKAIDIPASLSPYTEGMHTLSAIGDMTLIDAKKTDLSLKGIGLQIIREFKK